KEELFRLADIVTIHLVLSQRTKGLVGAAELQAMKPSARLINTSRGPIVDEPALIEVLRERRIAAAALDVFDIEPLPNFLWGYGQEYYAVVRRTGLNSSCPNLHIGINFCQRD